MINRIMQYACLNGVSGDEKWIREAIIKEIAPYCSYEIDPLGNLICFKKGMVSTDKRMMMMAHMDEVGFIITGITEEGLLKFSAVGGIDAQVVIGRGVRLSQSNHIGVIGTKAIHQQTATERETIVAIDQLWIDIGAGNKQEAENAVYVGERATFLTSCEEFGEDYLKGKALDDRIGCAMLVEMIKGKMKFDTYFVFSVQEEVGLRGAKAATYTINPDVALVVETTTAADLPMVPEHKQVCVLGKGAVVSYMDKAAIYDPILFRLARELAVEKKITAQTKNLIVGGNDGGAIHVARGGVRTLAISVPARYLHSGVCMVKKEDIFSVYKLTCALADHVL